MACKSFQYTSTRSPNGTTYTFEEALLKGYAPDGGLFVPVEIPAINKRTLLKWSKLSYLELVVAIAQLFISPEEIPHSVLSALIQSAFSTFQYPEIIKSQRLSEAGHDIVLELFHGQTLSFKDLAMSCAAKFVQYFLEKRKKHLKIIVSTSGDTGAAAMAAFGDSVHVDMIVLYPLGRVTQIQELQMTTLTAASSNLHLFAIDGSSDDGDEIMKALFDDVKFKKENHLSNVNSINWARILIQMAHHFFSYFQVNPSCDGIVEVVCPSGAAGNLSAGTFAQAMGLPIHLVACVNENDFLYRMLTEGIIQTDEIVKHTLASAMDIQMPYNIERILFLLSNGDIKLIHQVISALDGKKAHQLPPNIRAKLSEGFSSSRTTNQDIIETMKRCWEETQYLICPHTATGLYYHYNNPRPLSISGRSCLATASPIKFCEALTQAEVPLPDMSLLKRLLEQPQKVTRLAEKSDWIPTLRLSIQAITGKKDAL